MSSTRRAKEGSPFRQERYCSSPEFERGLMAHLVAKRCDCLASSGDEELIFFLQFLSHQEGGLYADACPSSSHTRTRHQARWPERSGWAS